MLWISKKEELNQEIMSLRILRRTSMVMAEWIISIIMIWMTWKRKFSKWVRSILNLTPHWCKCELKYRISYITYHLCKTNNKNYLRRKRTISQRLLDWFRNCKMSRKRKTMKRVALKMSLKTTSMIEKRARRDNNSSNSINYNNSS